MKSITTTTSRRPNNPSARLLLLQEWISHDDASYHHFSPTQAAEIRSALLSWYRSNRRKLPWRGDAPPYDGSTAGINSSSSSSKPLNDPNSSSKQTSLTSFFGASKPVPSFEENTISNTTCPKQEEDAAIPVSAYGVWVSEIMLQQTRVEAVIPYWIRWMKSFPTVQDLAAASEEQVNAHWAGLGFYRRARLLHQGAKHVVEKREGKLPETRDELLTISGIGPYTASAIASIAFGVCTPVVDGNVCRVLSRLTGVANHIKAPILKDKLGWDLATQLVQAGDGQHVGELNQALMELGATYCAPNGSGIDPRDPLRDFYQSTKLGRAYRTALLAGDEVLSLSEENSCTCELCNYPSGIKVVLDSLLSTISKNVTEDEAAAAGHASFPLDPPKLKKREEDLAVGVISNKIGGETWWLLVKRPKEGLLAGQWEFPSSCVQIRQSSKEKAPSMAVRRKALTACLEAVGNGDDWVSLSVRTPLSKAPLEHIFSHVKHIMWVEMCTAEMELTALEWKTEEGREVRWMREKDMKKVGITSGLKKVLKAVQEREASSVQLKKRKR